MRRGLTWRYTLVTVAALLAAEAIGLALLQSAGRGPTYIAQPGAAALEGMRAEVRDHLAGGAGAAALQQWLGGVSLPVFGLTDATGRPQVTLYSFPRAGTQSILVVDRNPRLLAATPGEGWPAAGERLDLARAAPCSRPRSRAIGCRRREQPDHGADRRTMPSSATACAATLKRSPTSRSSPRPRVAARRFSWRKSWCRMSCSWT